MSAGRVPAMINFTAGAANILAACKAAEVTTIVTSRAFIEKGKLGGLVADSSRRRVNIVYLEDVRATVDHRRQAARPARRPRSRWSRASPDDPAAILFTSGSEGTPKGVVLSHRNMLANAAQAAARIDFGRTDKVFNVLPVFHSFGLTVGHDPAAGLRRARSISIPRRCTTGSCRSWSTATNATILFGTDTFLAGYARAAHPYDFRSLRYILAGAEPVQGGDAAHLHGEIRPAHPRRLRRDRDRAGARPQHADVQQVRHRRPADARHGGAARAGARHRRRRPALRARART